MLLSVCVSSFRTSFHLLSKMESDEILLSRALKRARSGASGSDDDADDSGRRVHSSLLETVETVSLDELDEHAGSRRRPFGSSGDRTEDPNAHSCCDCTGCGCSCHVDEGQSVDIRPIDSYVCYLFDYDLFSVPSNRQHFDLLLEYLRDESILDRCVVVSLATDTYRSAVDSRAERSEIDPNVLRYRPSIIESIEETRSDVRRSFRNLIVQGSVADWFTVKASLHYPTYLVYIRLVGSRNDLRADYVLNVDYANRVFTSNKGSYGLKIAKLVAHTRAKYFGIRHYNFTPLIENARLRALKYRASKDAARERRERLDASKNEDRDVRESRGVRETRNDRNDQRNETRKETRTEARIDVRSVTREGRVPSVSASLVGSVQDGLREASRDGSESRDARNDRLPVSDLMRKRVRTQSEQVSVIDDDRFL